MVDEKQEQSRKSIRKLIKLWNESYEEEEDKEVIMKLNKELDAYNTNW